MNQREQLIAALYAELGSFKRVLMGARDQLMCELQLSRNQVEVLLLLTESNELTVGDIAARQSVTHSASTQTVETLVKRGLVLRESDTRDRRIVRVRLTDAGKKLTHQLHQQRIARMNQVVDGLTDIELELMVSVMRKLRDQFDPETNQETPDAL
jgi:DNA-binding MarR family transcriptional regulator